METDIVNSPSSSSSSSPKEWRRVVSPTRAITSDHTSPITILLYRQRTPRGKEEKRREGKGREERGRGNWRNWTREGADGETTYTTYVRIVPRELTGEIKRRRGRGKWENTPADTEADAANDSVRGNLPVLSVLATWGPTYFESRNLHTLPQPRFLPPSFRPLRLLLVTLFLEFDSIPFFLFPFEKRCREERSKLNEREKEK